MREGERKQKKDSGKENDGGRIPSRRRTRRRLSSWRKKSQSFRESDSGKLFEIDSFKIALLDICPYRYLYTG